MIGEAVHVRGQRVYGKSLYLTLKFAVNLKQLKKLIFKKKFKIKKRGEWKDNSLN